MQSEKFLIETIPNDEISEELLRQYWEFEDKYFCFTVKELAERANVTVNKFQPLVAKYSKVSAKLGVCKCGSEIIESVKNRSGFLSIAQIKKLNMQFNCVKCAEIKAKEIRASRLHQIDDSYVDKETDMQLAIKETRWVNLTDNELEVLYKIARHWSKSDIYTSIFPYGPTSPLSQPIWDIVNKLDKMSLIWIKRNDSNSGVNNIHTLPNLATIILMYYDPTYEEKSNESNKSDLNEGIKMWFKKSLNKNSVRQHEFAGSLSFDKEIIFIHGEKYCYNGWLNDNGSVFIEIYRNEKSMIDSVVPLLQNQQTIIKTSKIGNESPIESENFSLNSAFKKGLWQKPQ